MKKSRKHTLATWSSIHSKSCLVVRLTGIVSRSERVFLHGWRKCVGIEVFTVSKSNLPRHWTLYSFKSHHPCASQHQYSPRPPAGTHQPLLRVPTRRNLSEDLSDKFDILSTPFGRLETPQASFERQNPSGILPIVG
jgi:hypothetical protein